MELDIDNKSNMYLQISGIVNLFRPEETFWKQEQIYAVK